MSDTFDHLHLDPDSEYFGMRLNRDASNRVILAFGNTLAKSGDKVRFLNKNGHDWEREDAIKAFGADAVLTVERISVGRSSSRYYFKDVPSYWNTVMFERVPGESEGRADGGEQVRSEAEPVPSPATQTKGEG